MNEQYVDSFINEGLLFMNNIDYFRNYEDKDDALRGDIHEGLLASRKSDISSVYIGNHKLEGLTGKIDIRSNEVGDTNIYSMTKISDEKILEAGASGLYLSEDFEKFGNRAILIGGSNIKEFELILEKEVSLRKEIFILQQENIIAKQVEYVDRNAHHPYLTVFNKFEKYSWQHEW